eukprot:TCONS_00040139-protein
MRLLPTKNTSRVLMESFKILFARMLVDFLPAFKCFTKNVTRHISHPFSKKMNEKSDVVSLGVIFEGEQSSSGIAEISKQIQERYTPVKINEDGKTEILKPILVVGDQLTEERFSNIKKAFQAGDTSFTRLEGIQPAFTDWHLLKTLFEIKDKIFRKDSSSEFGTSTWSINVLQTVNAKKDPHKNYNSYKEYSDKELSAEAVAMTMTYFNMKNLCDNKNVSKNTKQLLLFYQKAKYIIKITSFPR